LWFWNTEIGWARVHPALELHGWQYEETCVWDKGLSHVAGNCNGKTIRGMPVVTELAVRYTRRATLPDINGVPVSLKDWVRSEWARSGLPMHKANKACGVANAATRKYLTRCHLWYFPPPEALVRMAAYCEKHGLPTDRPYFSIDGVKPPVQEEWKAMRAKWKHVHGLTNVWSEPPVHGSERLKAAGTSRYLHANQKPLALVERQIRACTDDDDVVWEPFGGLFSASVAAAKSGRRAFAAEINHDFFVAGSKRLQSEVSTRFARAINAA
jgi:site-specific DNA-methyltransferase (adenine-specific)